MSKIKLLHNEGPEPIFEKSGIKTEFRIADIDGYLDILDAQKDELTNKASQHKLGLEQLTSPELEIAHGDLEDFMVYSNWRAQILIAEERIKELEEEHAEFATTYDALSDDQKKDVAKWIGSTLVIEQCTNDLETIEETINEYTADKAAAESCLEETTKQK